MSEETQQIDMTKKKVLYEMPGIDAVTVRRDVEYRTTDTGALTMDIYYPLDWKSGARTPAVVIVTGYPDLGFAAKVGCKFKDMGSSVSWGQLMAASGFVAIAYTNREPAADLHALLDYIRQNSESLGIDETRIGLWSSSGNVPLALSVLIGDAREYLKCAVMCYGYMLDLEGATNVAGMARAVGFVNPCAGNSVDDLPKHIPLFIARAGQDELPHLNETLDRFLFKALTCNLPITFVNHAAAPHAFDLLHDSEETREIIKQILAFMRFHMFRQE